MFSEPYQTRSFTSFTLLSLSLPLRLSQNPTAHFSTLIFAILLSLPPQKWLILIKMHMLTSAPDFSSSLSLIYAFLLTLSLHLSHTTSPLSLPLSFLAVSWGAEANEGWLRLLWLLQGHWLHGWLQWRLRTAVSPAARAPRRWPQFQQRAHVLRVRITLLKDLKGVCGQEIMLPREISSMSDIKIRVYFLGQKFAWRKWDTYMGNNQHSFAIAKSHLDGKTPVRDYILKSIITPPIVTINSLLISMHISSIPSLDWSLRSTYYSPS